MNANAIGRNLRISPFKMRKVIQFVRGKVVTDALYILGSMPHKAAKMAYKVIFSAASNFKNKFPEQANKDKELKIEEIFVGQAPVLKRMMPRARGRADVLRKQSCHLSVIVNGGEENKTER